MIWAVQKMELMTFADCKQDTLLNMEDVAQQPQENCVLLIYS